MNFWDFLGTEFWDGESDYYGKPFAESLWDSVVLRERVVTDSSLSLPPFLCLQKEKRKLFFLAFSSLSLSLSSALQVLSLSLISFFCFFFLVTIEWVVAAWYQETWIQKGKVVVGWELNRLVEVLAEEVRPFISTCRTRGKQKKEETDEFFPALRTLSSFALKSILFCFYWYKYTYTWYAFGACWYHYGVLVEGGFEDSMWSQSMGLCRLLEDRLPKS